jgi:glycerol-3-phosphate dehydrogenase
VYGARAGDIDVLATADAALAEPLCPYSGAVVAEVIYAFEQERARTLADVLFRRCMAGLSPDLGRAAMLTALAKAGPLLGWNATRSEEERRLCLAEMARLAWVAA